jgi:death-on-curing protein
LSESQEPLLTAQKLAELNREVLEYGDGLHGVRYLSGLRYAAHRPWLVFEGVPGFPTPYAKAAALTESLIRSRPFVDGNKRTAYIAGRALLADMKSKYLDLQTGEIINAKQLLAWEQGKDRVWEAADELRLLLADIAEVKKEEAQELLTEVAALEDCLRNFDLAEANLDAKAKDFINKHRISA